MAWSIFTEGGGPGAAYTWAVDLLRKIGAPLSTGNEQMIFDWETSEGGGGKYNPLNQGPDPGHPELTSTGAQYGGGAADYVSWSAGLQGAADYLAMPAFAPIATALKANDPVTARADLISSPWAASHYGGGQSFSNTALPGKASALGAAGGSADTTAAASSNPLTAIAGIGTTLQTAAIVGPIVIGGAALIVWGFARMTNAKAPKIPGAAKIGALAA